MRIALRLNVVIFLLLLSCKHEGKAEKIEATKRGLIAESAMVVSAREEASKVGIEILKKGGNAFDAEIRVEHHIRDLEMIFEIFGQ